MYTRILLNRLTPIAEDILGEEQVGFRQGRSTTDQIFTLRMILEKYREYNKDLHQLFVDYRQAYDSIHRSSMWHILEQYNIPKKLIRLIKACYTNSKCCVKVGTDKTKYFDIKSGLKQGCMLSPILFNLTLEIAIRLMRGIQQGAEVDNSKINTLAYADDVVLLSETEAGLEELNTSFIDMGRRVGLECNETKTKKMLMSRHRRIDGHTRIGDLNIENVQTFKYLGSTIDSDNSMDAEVSERIGNANRCAVALHKVLTRNEIS